MAWYSTYEFRYLKALLLGLSSELEAAIFWGITGDVSKLSFPDRYV